MTKLAWGPSPTGSPGGTRRTAVTQGCTVFAEGWKQPKRPREGPIKELQAGHPAGTLGVCLKK